MLPYLLDFGRHELPLLGEVHLALPTYGLLFAASVLIAGAWFIRRARGLGIAEDVLYNLTFVSLLASLAGAKLMLIAIDWREYAADPARLLGTLRVAGVLLGGVIAGALTFLLYARRHGLPVAALCDAAAAPLALGQAIGRLGCLAAGCCWGVEVAADHPLAIVFTDPYCQAPLGRPLLAIQPLQLLFDLGLAGALTWLWRRRPQPPGTVAWCFVLLYGLGRGVLEFWRGDAERGLFFDRQVSTSQILALAGVVLATLLLLRGQLLRRRAVLGLAGRS